MIRKLTLWFEHLDAADEHLVGSHALSLGRLTQGYFPVPQGFVITSESFNFFLTENKLDKKIEQILTTLNAEDPEELPRKSEEIKKLIVSSAFPTELKHALLTNYAELISKVNKSKSTVEKIVSAFESKSLPVIIHGEGVDMKRAEGEGSLADAVRLLWAEHYSPHYLKKTRNPKGQLIVQAKTNPDFRVSLFPIDKNKLHLTKDLDRYEIDRKNPSVIDPQILQGQKLPRELINKLLALYLDLEKHFYFPINVELGLESGDPHILSIKPHTELLEIEEKPTIENKAKAPIQIDVVTLSGTPGSPGRKTAPGKLVKNYHEASKKILPGDILITDEITNHYLPILKKVSGIITTKGSRHSHAATFAKKRGIPSILIEENLLLRFKDGQVITVDGQTGEVRL